LTVRLSVCFGGVKTVDRTVRMGADRSLTDACSSRPETDGGPRPSAVPLLSRRAEFAIRGRTVLEPQTVELGGADFRPRRRQRRNSPAPPKSRLMTGLGRKRNSRFARSANESRHPFQ